MTNETTERMERFLVRFRAGFASAAAQEREARAGEPYQEFLGSLYQARLELEIARSELEYLRMSATLSQTRKANERAEIRAYQST